MVSTTRPMAAEATRNKACRWSGSNLICRVAAEHGYARAVLGTTKGNQVLADVRCDDLAVLGAGVGENPLYEIIPKLIAGNINERDAGTIRATLADTVEIAVKKFISSDLETLFNNLGCILVGTVLGGETKD